MSQIDDGRGPQPYEQAVDLHFPPSSKTKYIPGDVASQIRQYGAEDWQKVFALGKNLDAATRREIYRDFRREKDWRVFLVAQECFGQGRDYLALPKDMRPENNRYAGEYISCDAAIFRLEADEKWLKEKLGISADRPEDLKALLDTTLPLNEERKGGAFVVGVRDGVDVPEEIGRDLQGKIIRVSFVRSGERKISLFSSLHDLYRATIHERSSKTKEVEALARFKALAEDFMSSDRELRQLEKTDLGSDSALLEEKRKQHEPLRQRFERSVESFFKRVRNDAKKAGMRHYLLYLGGKFDNLPLIQDTLRQHGQLKLERRESEIQRVSAVNFPEENLYKSRIHFQRAALKRVYDCTENLLERLGQRGPAGGLAIFSGKKLTEAQRDAQATGLLVAYGLHEELLHRLGQLKERPYSTFAKYATECLEKLRKGVRDGNVGYCRSMLRSFQWQKAAFDLQLRGEDLLEKMALGELRTPASLLIAVKDSGEQWVREQRQALGMARGQLREIVLSKDQQIQSFAQEARASDGSKALKERVKEVFCIEPELVEASSP